MGHMASRLTREEQESYGRSITTLVKLFEPQDPAFAQLIKRTTKVTDSALSDSDVKEIIKHVTSKSSPLDRKSQATSSRKKTNHALQSLQQALIERKTGIENAIDKTEWKWREDPQLFWGVGDLSDIPLEEVIEKLYYTYVCDPETEKVIVPVRRRFALYFFSEVQEDIETRIQPIVTDLGFKIKRGVKITSIAFDIFESICLRGRAFKKRNGNVGNDQDKEKPEDEVAIKSQREICRSQLREGKRWSKFEPETLLGLGNVPSKIIERCSLIEYGEIVENFKLSSHQQDKLHEMAMSLKRAFWKSKPTNEELERMIKAHLHSFKDKLIPAKQKRKYGNRDASSCKKRRLNAGTTITLSQDPLSVFLSSAEVDSQTAADDISNSANRCMEGLHTTATAGSPNIRVAPEAERYPHHSSRYTQEFSSESQNLDPPQEQPILPGMDQNGTIDSNYEHHGSPFGNETICVVHPLQVSNWDASPATADPFMQQNWDTGVAATDPFMQQNWDARVAATDPFMQLNWDARVTVADSFMQQNWNLELSHIDPYMQPHLDMILPEKDPFMQLHSVAEPRLNDPFMQLHSARGANPSDPNMQLLSNQGYITRLEANV